MFCIVFESTLWYYHQFFIVWKSNLWCFCIFCVVLEAKLWNCHMFWHFSSILHRVDHHFIMNTLFFLQFLHIFDPNLPTTPSVNWTFAVVSWLLAAIYIWHKPRGKEKNMAFIPVLHQPKAKGLAVPARKWAQEMCTTCEIQRSRTWLHPFKAMEQRSAPNQDMQATCVHTERSDRIVSSSCIVLGRSQMRVCPVVNFGDQQTYQRDTVAARNRHTSARWRRARRRTHLAPAAASGWQSWRLRQTGRRKSGSKTLKGCHGWDPTIVFWWFGAWAASNTRTLQGGCTPYFPHETVEQRSLSTWHRFRELFLPQRPRNRDAGQICQGKVFRKLSRWSGKWCFKLLATAGITPQVNFKAVGLQCTELPGTRALASFRTSILMRKSLPNMWF